MDVQIEDISESVSALALQGPTSGRLLKSLVEDADIANLKYFRVTKGTIAGVPVEISRTGYTGDLGYEIWIASDKAIRVWDALMETGRAFDIHPAGMLALDVARVEAGLLLIEVDFNSSKKALVDEQRYSPFELGLGRLVNLDKNRFVGQTRFDRRTEARPPARDCWSRDRLAAGRKYLRKSRPAAGSIADGIASRCACVQGRNSGR